MISDTAEGSQSLRRGGESNRPRLSVLICTRNRCKKLAATLESVAACQDPNGVPWEILVVDNGSTDGTREVVSNFVATARVPTKCVWEPRRGHNRALNAGILEVKGQWVLFTDDDVRVSPDWLVQVVQEYQADPALSGIGGRVELYDTNAPPVAVRRSKKREIIGPLNIDPLNVQIIGCNMSIRRDVLENIGGFDEALGPGSPSGAVAGDLDILYRLARNDQRVVYSPDVLVFHDHDRTSSEDLSPVVRGYVRGRGAFYWKYLMRGDRRVAKLAYWEGRRLVAQIGRALLSRSMPWEALRVVSLMIAGALRYSINRLALLVKRS